MDRPSQIQRAEHFRQLHHDSKLLVLPNIWDPFGARLLVSMGFPAVATASMAVALSHGYLDGENVPRGEMLEAIERISRAVDVPVSADIERGYGATPEDVADTVTQVIAAGAVGVNIEDGTGESGIRSVDEQCARITAAREAARSAGVPLFINARIDAFMASGTTPDDLLEDTRHRAKAYAAAGADGIYPITLNSLDSLKELRDAAGVPVNVYAQASTPDMRMLERAGIARLSIGPSLLKAAATTMRAVADDLLNYRSYDAFTKNVLTSAEINRYARSK